MTVDASIHGAGPPEDHDEALVRAFVLGVAGVERELDRRLDRLRDTASNEYERQLIETAFHEGRHLDRDSPEHQPITADDLPPFLTELDHDIIAAVRRLEASRSPASLDRPPFDSRVPNPRSLLRLPEFLRR